MRQINAVTPNHERTPRQGKVPPGLLAHDMKLLEALPLFEGLDRHKILHLLEESWCETLPAGKLLFLQGDPADSFFVVLDGWVKLFRSSPDGNESVIAVLPSGEPFAEAAAFEEGTYPVSAATVERSRLLVIPTAHFVTKIVSDGRLAMQMMAAMSRRLRQLVNQVEDLSLKSSVERLAGYISTLCPEGKGRATCRLPLDKALIARHLGMQPETFSRSLARLRALGIIVEGEKLEVADLARLRDICGGAQHAALRRTCQPSRPNP